MKLLLTISLLFFFVPSQGQDNSYRQVQTLEMEGYMFSTAPFDWYFVPCSDSSIDLLRALAYNNDSSFWVQHSLGCGKGINSSQFGKLGRKLMHTFLYPGNTVAIDTIRYFYGRIWFIIPDVIGSPYLDQQKFTFNNTVAILMGWCLRRRRHSCTIWLRQYCTQNGGHFLWW